MKRVSLTILLLPLIILFSSAQTGCVSGDCENGFGIYKFSDGDIFEGTFLDGKKHGWGCHYYKDGGKSNQVYCGNWRFGEKHYFGAKFWKELPDGSDFFLGMYEEGYRQKYGVYVYESGNPKFRVDPVYYTKPGITSSSRNQTGCISGDCQNGFGIQRYSDGDVYEGNFLNGERHGWGSYYYHDGGESKAIYCGNWRYGDAHYFGTYFWNEAPESTDFFLGLYKDGQRQDQGIYVYESGNPDFKVQATDYSQPKAVMQIINNPFDDTLSDLVTGCEAGDCQNGFGIYRYSDGDVYEGYFLDGQRHGWGSYFYNQNGKATQVYSGHWRNGDKHHFGAHFWNEPFQGDFFFGMYKNNVRQKHGVYVDEDGQASFHNITTSNAYKDSNDLLVKFLEALFSSDSNYEYEDSGINSYTECHACNGSGAVYSGGMVVNCGACNGTGRK